MKIYAKVKIHRVEEWSTNWNNEADRMNELEKLIYDMKMAIFEQCGIDLNNIEIELELFQ